MAAQDAPSVDGVDCTVQWRSWRIPTRGSHAARRELGPGCRKSPVAERSHNYPALQSFEKFCCQARERSAAQFQCSPAIFRHSFDVRARGHHSKNGCK